MTLEIIGEVKSESEYFEECKAESLRQLRINQVFEFTKTEEKLYIWQKIVKSFFRQGFEFLEDWYNDK